jgi:hypothetical protein
MKRYRKIVIPIILILSISIVYFDLSGAAGVKTVEGYIYDKDFNPLAGVRVILSMDGRFIGGIVTDQTGWFILEFESGDNDICSLNILSKNYRGIFSDVEIVDDTTYVEYNLETVPPDMTFLTERVLHDSLIANSDLADRFRDSS